ncbi:MAG: DNA alkylation repair protein [Candidatus Humimicrobiia bacterium]
MSETKKINEVIKELKSLSDPRAVEGMAKFGIRGEKRIGVSIPELRRMAKTIGKDHKLALKLWSRKIPETMILASMVDDPEKVTEQQMEDWVKDINSWDVCDQLCMNLFEKVPFIIKKIKDWSKRDGEFVKRTAYSLIACLAWHDKESSDEKFINFIPIIKSGATDERNFVKKAVNWALRNIGKRNLNLNKVVIKAAKEIQKMDSKVARWIASDAIRELTSEKIQNRLAKKG